MPSNSSVSMHPAQLEGGRLHPKKQLT